MFPVCSHESTVNRTRNPAGTALVIGNREWQRSAAESLEGKARCPGANRTDQLTYCQLIIFRTMEYGSAANTAWPINPERDAIASHARARPCHPKIRP